MEMLRISLFFRIDFRVTLISLYDFDRIQVIKEVLDVKKRNSHISSFHNEDLQDTLYYFCTYEVLHAGYTATGKAMWVFLPGSL